MKKLCIIGIFGSFALLSCVKDRTCECKNQNGTYDAGVTKGTKAQAKKHCKSLSGGGTDCYLKK
jgi:hypothetical protein